MYKLLQEISVIPGVIGSCIFEKNEGPICKDLHPILSEDLLRTIGVHLVRLIQMSKMAELSIQSSHFRYDKYTVVGMPLETGAVLLTICDSHANCSLVATTAAMLVVDMREELDRGATRADDKSSEEAPESDDAEIEVVEVDNADIEVVEDDDLNSDDQALAVDEDDADMQSLYDEIEQTLAGAIGPVAGLVMQDYLDKWKEKGPAVPGRLDELAKMLEEEIGDDELAKDFANKIKSSSFWLANAIAKK